MIKLLELQNSIQVARLHRKAFPDSALSLLGLRAVRRYYEWLLTGPHDCYAIGLFDSNNILIGFCFAGIFQGSLSGYLKRNAPFLIFQGLLRPWLILNPLIKDRLFLARKTIRQTNLSQNYSPLPVKTSYGILSIAVDPGKQGTGIGKMIMENVETEAMRKGFYQLHLTVSTKNIQAVKFYERCGWVKGFNESGDFKGFMKKSLNQ